MLNTQTVFILLFMLVLFLSACKNSDFRAYAYIL